ncbi:histone-lysine N-methyltransferase SUVR2-like [Hibiscus syriacus]|uniref:Arp2/3 complex 34 kDa subunit n=1 Tax=Hibiscus syriacus TaxID=106335 RepID=A0A6A3AMW5_HIBSY|nr:histone-lysine N-methyltransferase SUVR2-like [Hibiscus syriacus]
MAIFERASPALKEILLRIYNAEKPIEVDHHLYEFGSVEYYIKSSASEPFTYLSISTPLLSQGVFLSHGLSPYILKMIREISIDVITEVSSVQAVILSSQLKEMLQNVNSWDISQGMYKPIKLIYHPREPFYVIRQESLDCKVVGILNNQILYPRMALPWNVRGFVSLPLVNPREGRELMGVGSSGKWAKVPPCNWSPISPPELRGEPFEDLSTNGGFISFDISSHHVERKRLDKTVRSLLNFYAYVKYHVKCTRGFIQRRMRRRMDSLVQVLSSVHDHTAYVLEKSMIEENGDIQMVKGWKKMKKWMRLTSKSKMIKRRYHDITKKIKRIHFRIKIHGFVRFRRRWLTMPNFSSSM